MRNSLSDADRDRITELAELGMGAKRIGKVICKPPGTVQWFMYTAGLRAPKRHGEGREPQMKLFQAGYFVRRGRFVYRYTPDEDRFIERLRTDGVSLREIARLANEQFGRARTHHTVRCRLIMLAARDEEVA